MTGYLNCMRIDLPVLEERADEEYHNPHRRIKTMLDCAFWEDAGDVPASRGEGIV